MPFIGNDLERVERWTCAGFDGTPYSCEGVRQLASNPAAGHQDSKSTDLFSDYFSREGS